MNTKAHNLSKYQLVECIARGGMGEVWKALDTQLKRYVAIKLLHARMQQDPDFITRFEQEARLIASLRHPNIIKIHDFKIDNRQGSDSPTSPLCYMVMDYVPGQTLADYISNTSRRGEFPPAVDIAYIFTAVGLALDYAHQCGMIHRDIKPANILLDKRTPTARTMGEPILTDFGIARQRGTTSGTMVGSVIGTPKYIAPEQAQGQYDDPRSDLYSLGIILYEIMTGEAPFRADTPLAIVMQHLREKPRPPETINPQVSPALSQVILKSIAKNPDERFPTGSALALALTQAFHIPAPEDLPSASRLAGSSVGPSSADATLPGISSHPPLGGGVQTPFIEQPLDQSHGGNGYQLKHKKRWMIGLTALLVLVLLGSSLLARILLSASSTSGSAGETVIGHISFIQNGSSQNYNAVQIDITHVPALPEGMAYYAWIGLVNDEDNENIVSPHWELPVSHQAIHTAHLTFAGFDNLYVPPSLFLITKEQTATPPIVPDPNPAARLYYARVTSATIDLKQCPANGADNVCFS